MSELYRKPRNVRVIYYDDDKAYPLDQFVQNVTVKGNVAQSYREMTVSFVNTNNGRKKMREFKNGRQIRLIVNSNEQFRGIVWDTEIDNEGFQTITAYDYNYYLTKSTDSLKFKNKTATEIIKEICDKFEIETGKMDDTGYKINKLIFPNKTLYDMMIVALTETEKKTGKTYRLFSERGQLCLRERKKQLHKLIIENERNLLSFSYKESIDNVITQVRVTNNEEESGGVTVKNDKRVEEYGIIQHYENDKDATKKEMQEFARQLLKENQLPNREFKIEALGIWGIEAGTALGVREKMTGVQGGFYVQADTHSYDANGTHTMALTLSKTLDIDRQDYEPPSETQEQSTGGTSTPVAGSSYVPPQDSPTRTSGGFIKPAAGRITSGFRTSSRPNHHGIDIAQGGYNPVRAAASGTVSRSYRSATYGETVMITHTINGQTYETVYAHMRTGSRRVRVGQSVRQGQVIGIMGNTGNSRGQHLHFEIHRGRWNSAKSNAVNPANYI